MNKRVLASVALFGALALSLGACGSSSDSGGTSPSSSSSTSAAASPSDSAAGVDFGTGCAGVPKDATNAGSFQAMAKVPVATAASGNPLLSTLVSLVTKENLVDSLNNAQGITVFAPTNDAFAKIPPATLKALTDAQLASILKLHVVGQQLTPDQLAGSHPTLNGGTVTVSGSGTSFTAAGAGNSSPANVVCGNVQTANATVYIVDSVLMPKM
jgi:uncharacterized surface protein with fasciclin (FAS1) repeats